jgi:uncharacterized membrane protein
LYIWQVQSLLHVEDQAHGFVESVTQVTDTLTEWKMKVGGVEREFEALITEQHPDERLAWNSTGGPVDHAIKRDFVKSTVVIHSSIHVVA